MIACRVLGHRYRFRADGPTMYWECTRNCGAGGSKRYASAEDANRYAAGLERDGGPPAHGRAPLISTLPLWLLRRVHRSRKAG